MYGYGEYHVEGVPYTDPYGEPYGTPVETTGTVETTDPVDEYNYDCVGDAEDID